MNTVRKLVIGVGALSAMTTVARAQPPASDTATASGTASIIQPIAATSTQNLAFGTIVKPTGAGTATVTVDTSGGRSVSGGAVALSSTTATAATFNVIGEGGSAYSVSVPSTFDMVSGSNTLVVSTTNNSGNGGTLTGSIGSTQTATFGVGGTFNLTSSTASGAYTGNIQVIASYQ